MCPFIHYFLVFVRKRLRVFVELGHGGYAAHEGLDLVLELLVLLHLVVIWVLFGVLFQLHVLLLNRLLKVNLLVPNRTGIITENKKVEGKVGTRGRLVRV